SSADLGLHRENPANHQGGTEGPEQKPTNPGGRNQTAFHTYGHLGYSDYGHRKYFNDSGETAAENEEGIDGHLLHGDRSAPGLHHGFNFKAFDIDIVPEEDDDRRRRKRKSR
ncbi:MAG TPA: hypothetical protein VKZ95_01470, partial [Sphingobacteriaceae bacterium]|nr:hypothetical protein [Sphingobacteriaceae bacterium]